MLNDLMSFSATETGYNHSKAQPAKVCEDASAAYNSDLLSICVVSDGHGSDNYPRTDRGSKFAVQAAVEMIKEFVKSIYNPYPKDKDKSTEESQELISHLLEKDIDELHPLKNLSQSILALWYDLVENDYMNDPFRENELINVSDKYKKRYLSDQESRFEKAYGCTLIAYAITSDFSFGLQIGDGKCVVVNHSGHFEEPIPWDENCQLNVTTSICDSDAADEFRFCITKERPAAVFCGSDGIDDSYASMDEVYALYRSMLQIFIEHGADVFRSEIKEYLPLLTRKGSGDDVSVALIIDQAQVRSLEILFEEQALYFDQVKASEAEYQKKRQEENPVIPKKPDVSVNNAGEAARKTSGIRSGKADRRIAEKGPKRIDRKVTYEEKYVRKRRTQKQKPKRMRNNKSDKKQKGGVRAFQLEILWRVGNWIFWSRKNKK